MSFRGRDEFQLPFVLKTWKVEDHLHPPQATDPRRRRQPAVVAVVEFWAFVEGRLKNELAATARDSSSP